MFERINRSKLRWLWLVPLIAVPLALILLAVNASIPPGDCWNGALSADPMQCHALQEVQRDGLIEVEGIYQGGNSLYIYFEAAGDLSSYDELQQALREKANEFAAAYPGQVKYEDLRIHQCDSGDSESVYRECMIDYTFMDDRILPWAGDYHKIKLRPGGAEARKTEGGWASWSQLWLGPGVASSPIQSPEPSDATAFYVKGVDMTNIPDMDCSGRYNTNLCMIHERNSYPGFDIVGWHEVGGNTPLYLEVKAAADKEDEVTAALKAELSRRGLDIDRIVIIPAKYSFDEYWRWSVVLNRFAESPGNTIGVRSAVVGTNFGGYHVELYPLPNLGQSVDINKSDMRTTIELRAYDAQRVVDALPTLLPLLDIPVDAVGIAGEFDERPVVPTLTGHMSGPGVQRVIPDGGGGLLVVAAGGVVALAALGSLLFLLLRRRLRQSPSPSPQPSPSRERGSQ